MPILLSCQDLARTFGARPLFSGLSLGLDEGERTGLIGPNGAGKSTLLKTLAGLEKPDRGEVSFRRNLHVRYLPQTEVLDESARRATVGERLRGALEDIKLEAWETGRRLDRALADSGLEPDRPVGTLSGGWRKRLAILAEVVREPDILFLDEPTNHLDLDGVIWLESFLNGLRFSFVVVTHDRRFLETVCNRVIELNPRHEGGYFSSPGNYSRFIENREAMLEAQAAREESARNIVRREIEWLRKGPRARTTKQKARIERAGGLIEDLAELSYRNAQDRTAGIDFAGSERRSRKLIEVLGAEKSLGGRRLFGALDLVMGPGDKLGLLGANGSGKSTFLNLLAGRLDPDAGTVRRAEALKVVLFDQQREQLDLSLTLRQAFAMNGDYVEYRGSRVHVFNWAARFLFSRDQLDMPLGMLSGGEQARVLIARLMTKPADLLLLDEPTNDLDINSLEVLEASMKDFPGALVLVTHDRYLLDRVSDRILSLDGKGEARFYADLAQWEDREIADAAPPPPAASPKKAPAPKAKKTGLSYKESRELMNMEDRIHAAEQDLAEANEALHDPSIAADAEELLARQAAVEKAQEKIDTLFARWEELEAKK